MKDHHSQNHSINEIEFLRAENLHLRTLLTKHGIPWTESIGIDEENEVSATAFSDEKKYSEISARIALFRSFFRGRSDVYPIRWESTKGKTGYSPACRNEWQSGICKKPQAKCFDCDNRDFLPVTDQVIYDHLAGKHTIGVYPLLADDTCYFLAIDFDEADWREDLQAFMQSCKILGVPGIAEISRSGKGAHFWIFFEEAILAKHARRLGAALISYTCARTRQLTLSSYDRFFPNQDTLPKGGLGNLIALPLQKKLREQGRCVLVDDNLQPFTDQWTFLSSVTRMNENGLEDVIQKSIGSGHPLDVAFVSEEDDSEPWKQKTTNTNQILGIMPKSLKLVIANQIFIEKIALPQSLANRLIRSAAFQNPEFYKSQAMRLPVWNKPRIICCAEDFPQHIGLPRGCLDAVLDLLSKQDIKVNLQAEQLIGSPISVGFVGELRTDQKIAVEEMLKYDIGVLCAPTAFGKTIIAATLIARRMVSTLILVHRTELLRQWQERLRAFLALSQECLGVIGGGKKQLSGYIDIAVMQSLTRREDLQKMLDCYGQVIIDECHHVSAFSFESILKRVKARYVVGLTATPVRRDGHHPIIFMQCGPIRYKAKRSLSAPINLEVWLRQIEMPTITTGFGIQEIFRDLVTNTYRNNRIKQDIIDAYQEGRKILVLTERTEHLMLLREALGDELEHCYQLHGRLSKKQRNAILSELSELNESVPRVLLATGRLIGEGFDYPPLDTLVIAMPISWKGTLQQYAGRLHRSHKTKQDVRIYDYVEYNHPQLARMWEKRVRGYRAMGYVVRSR